MFLVNLVGLLLLVGVLYESGVNATEQISEQSSDIRGAIISLVDTYCNYSQVHLNTEAALTLFEPDAKVFVPGFPPFVGHDEIRTLVELYSEKASRIDINYKEVEPMDKDANLVYGTFHDEFVNESGAKYADGELSIFKKTKDGYKYYIAMVNGNHNLSG